jgi:hypothetical protein
MLELTLLRAGMPDRHGSTYTVEVLQEMAKQLRDVPNVEKAWLDGTNLKVRLGGNLKLSDFNQALPSVEGRARRVIEE